MAKKSYDFQAWYAELKTLAARHGENVSDADTWREECEEGASPEDAFYEEYPEHKPTKKVVEFRGEKCRVEFAKYDNDRIAIQLVIDGTGEPMATATSNLIDEKCKPNQTHIKDYSENSGIYDVLSAAGIVRHTGVIARSGYCKYLLVDVLV